MQGWYWNFPKTGDGFNWSDTLQSKVSELQDGGITYLWLPPTSRTSSGNWSNGYDPKDLFDLGEYGLGATHFGTRAQVDALIAALDNVGIKSVADVVYNHRDGGLMENNSAVEAYIDTFMTSDKNAYPSDRFRCILPIGGSTGHGVGDYYFKVSSKTQDSKYFNKEYKVYMQTNTVGWQGLTDTLEHEPNGGGDCGEVNNSIALGRDWIATVDGGTCKTDEFHLNLKASDFDLAGDTIFIYLNNPNGNYSDHRIYGIWSGAEGADIVEDMKYQTYTDFTSLASGRGDMNFENFRPNSANKSTTKLDGFWDWPWWFYDYVQENTATRDTLIDWSKWLWDDVGYRGFRMDAVKHFPPQFVSELLNSLHDDGKDPGMIVGEFFDANTGLLQSWVNDVKAGMSAGALGAIHPRLFDFSLRDALKNSCDNAGYDSRNVFSSGMVDGGTSSGYDVVTFINNHDFRDNGQAIQSDPLLVYAYILTNNKIGLPCVYYSDYFRDTIPNADTVQLQFDINMLIEVQKNYIVGSSQIDYINRFSTPYYIFYHTNPSSMDKTTLIYQIKGGNGNPDNEVIIVINFSDDDLEVEFEVSSFSDLVEGDKVYDVLGKSQTPVVELDGDKHCYVAVPHNSYSIWVNNPVSSTHLDTILYVDQNADSLQNGQNWATAVKNLSSAIELASQNPQITEIWVKEGTYYPNILDDRSRGFELSDEIRIYGSFPNTENPQKTNRDLTLYPSIISGDIGVINDESDNVFHVINCTSTNEILLDGFQLKGGNANGGNVLDQCGGGIYNTGLLALRNVKITECSSLLNGSHVNNKGVNAHLLIKNCEFISLSAQNVSTVSNSDNSTLEVQSDNKIVK